MRALAFVTAAAALGVAMKMFVELVLNYRPENQ